MLEEDRPLGSAKLVLVQPSAAALSFIFATKASILPATWTAITLQASFAEWIRAHLM